MTPDQKKIIRRLIDQSIEHGFGTFFDINQIMRKEGIDTAIIVYDEDAQDGLLFKYGPYGNGMLSFSSDGKHASVAYDTHELLSNWAR